MLSNFFIVADAAAKLPRVFKVWKVVFRLVRCFRVRPGTCPYIGGTQRCSTL